MIATTNHPCDNCYEILMKQATTTNVYQQTDNRALTSPTVRRSQHSTKGRVRCLYIYILYRCDVGVACHQLMTVYAFACLLLRMARYGQCKCTGGRHQVMTTIACECARHSIPEYHHAQRRHTLHAIASAYSHAFECSPSAHPSDGGGACMYDSCLRIASLAFRRTRAQTPTTTSMWHPHDGTTKRRNSNAKPSTTIQCQCQSAKHEWTICVLCVCGVQVPNGMGAARRKGRRQHIHLFRYFIENKCVGACKGNAKQRLEESRGWQLDATVRHGSASTASSASEPKIL